MRTKVFVNIRVLITLALLFLSACNSNSESSRNNDFTKLLLHHDVKDLNSSVRLQLDPFKNHTLKIGDMIYLEGVNQSDKEIYFPANQNIQIFQFDNTSQKWIEIKNSVNYYGDGYTTVPKGQEGLQSILVALQPIIENSKEGDIRIAVTGFVVKNGNATDEPVSAYMDVNLSQ